MTKKSNANDNKVPKVSLYTNLSKANRDLTGCATEAALLAWVRKYKTADVKRMLLKGIGETIKAAKK